jgi:methyl-accepting chemotaxis protein|tara:strand:- start:210 stop:449 length:240 start_codon:yes stop_codon:yes gene_type:complete
MYLSNLRNVVEEVESSHSYSEEVVQALEERKATIEAIAENMEDHIQQLQNHLEALEGLEYNISMLEGFIAEASDEGVEV